MMIDRRVFVAGAALTAIAPVLPLMPTDAAMAETKAIYQPILMISGWSVPDETNLDQVWMRIGYGWKTAWR